MRVDAIRVKGSSDEREGDCDVVFEKIDGDRIRIHGGFITIPSDGAAEIAEFLANPNPNLVRIITRAGASGYVPSVAADAWVESLAPLDDVSKAALAIGFDMGNETKPADPRIEALDKFIAAMVDGIPEKIMLEAAADPRIEALDKFIAAMVDGIPEKIVLEAARELVKACAPTPVASEVEDAF